MISPISVTGRVKIEVHGEDGALKELREVDNLVVTAGRNLMASRLVGTSSAVMSHMAIGTGATAPAAGNTTLGTESARVALTSQTANNNTVTYVATFGAGTGTGSVTEGGIFNATPAGTMLARSTWAAVTKGAGDSMTITWVITIS